MTVVQSAVPSATVANYLSALIAGAGDRAAVVRGLSCSTHADGMPALEIALKGPGGEVLDRIG